MKSTILVTYAGSSSTADLAEAVAHELTRLGHLVHIRPIHKAVGARHFGAVVLGSDLDHGRWLPEAMTYLRQHEADLAERPTFLFQTVHSDPALDVTLPWALERLAFDIGSAEPESFDTRLDAANQQVGIAEWARRIHAALDGDPNDGSWRPIAELTP